MKPIMRFVLQLLAKYLCVLFHAVNPSVSLPALEVRNESYIAPTEPRVKAEIVSPKVENFFNPLTCWPRGNQKAMACKAGEHINETLCLEHQCCVSSRKFIQLDCYTPFEDLYDFSYRLNASYAYVDQTTIGPQQILRIFAVGIGGMLALVCLPFCCFIVERSPCANPLRRTPKEDDTEEESESSDESSDS